MSSACDFAQLGTSLEIIQAHALDPSAFSLVPDLNPHGIKLEKSTAFLGHCWKIFASMPPVSSFIFGTPEQPEEIRLAAIFTNIKKEFEKVLLEMQTASQRYRKALYDSSWKGSGPTKRERAAIFTIADSLPMFFSGRWKDCSLDIEPLQKQFTLRTCMPLVLPSEMQKFSRFAQDYAMVALEGILFQTYPMRAFSSIIEGRPLDALERDAVNGWNRCLVDKKRMLTPGLVHMALYGVVETLYKDETIDSKELSRRLFHLEWHLYRVYGKSGFQIFDEEDAHHLSWLRSLEVGKTKIQLQGKERLLGNQVFCQAFTDEKVAVYDLQDEPTKQVMVSLVNQVRLGVWQGTSRDIAWAARPIECKEIDPYGHFCIIERIHRSLEDVVWYAQKKDLDANEKAMLQPVVTLISGMKQQRAPAVKLELKNLFFVQKGDEWTVRAFPWIEQDPLFPKYKKYRIVSMLEAFAKECARDNRFVFCHLTHESGLIDHPLPVFYRNYLMERLLGVKQRPEDEAVADQSIYDPDIVDQLKAFVGVFPQVRDILYSRLEPRLKDPKKDTKKLNEAIARDLLEFLKDDAGYCTEQHPHILEQNYINGVERHILNDKGNRDLFV